MININGELQELKDSYEKETAAMQSKFEESMEQMQYI
jgi:hypothetical protein